MTSGGNNFNNFPENQLTKFRAFYDYKTFQRAKTTTNYRMHDSKLPLLTIGVTFSHTFNAHFFCCLLGHGLMGSSRYSNSVKFLIFTKGRGFLSADDVIDYVI